MGKKQNDDSWWIIYRTTDQPKWTTLSKHPNKALANRDSMQWLFVWFLNVRGVDLMQVHQDELDIYI